MTYPTVSITILYTGKIYEYNQCHLVSVTMILTIVKIFFYPQDN